jgi:hypothetical protein
METYHAYCATCDANVEVVLDPRAEHPLADAKFQCLDRCPSCKDALCPLEHATPTQLGERLEFLPREAHEPDERPDVDAEDLLQRARQAAMRRGQDPVR